MPTRQELKAHAKVGMILAAVPLQLGTICFFLMVWQGGYPEIETIFNTGFAINYGRKIGGYLWMLLWSFLWSLLFWIPGIIKAYSYSMTPYILAAYPDVKTKDALRLSMRIMEGHKWEYFVLILSFIGWNLLSLCTCGILEILYVGPYMQTTVVGYQSALLDLAVRNGLVSSGQLLGTEPVA